MSTLNFLYKRTIPINDKISIYIPTVREVVEDEDAYYSAVSMFTAMPIDMMVQLDDAGIDFSKIDAWQLFIIMFPALQEMDTHLILGDLDLSKFQLAVNKNVQQVILKNPEDGTVIDFGIHGQIAATLRHILHTEKDRRKPGNEAARKYMIERAREKQKRKRKKTQTSQLEPLIIAMVNSEQYKYNYEGTLDLTIYQFNESVRQVVKKDGYNHRMTGIYAGTVDVSKIHKKELDWLSND